MSAPAPLTTARPQPRIRAAWRRHGPFYGMVLPYVIVMLLFGLGPGLYALVLSFSSFKLGKPILFAAGFANYAAAFKDFRFGFTAGNIVKFLAISVPLGIALVVMVALLLHMRPGRISSALRTLYFIPGAINVTVVMLLSVICFNPDLSPYGSLMRAAGMQTMNDVIYPGSLALLFTLMGFFSGAGMWIAIQYGALEGIPTELLEASKIDGANTWQQLYHIKLPLIRPYIIYQFILIFSGNVQLFVEPQILGNQTYVQANVPLQWSPNQLAYSFAFDLGNFGSAAALSLLMLLIGLGASYIIIRWTRFFKIEA
jgi:multiple sugar transport system permease protein